MLVGMSPTCNGGNGSLDNKNAMSAYGNWSPPGYAQHRNQGFSHSIDHDAFPPVRTTPRSPRSFTPNQRMRGPLTPKGSKWQGRVHMEIDAAERLFLEDRQDQDNERFAMQAQQRQMLEQQRRVENERRFEQQRRLEQQRRMDEQRQMEQQRRMDEQRQIDQQRRMEEDRRFSEQRRMFEEQKKVDQERQRAMENQRRADESRRMEEQRWREAERQRALDNQRRSQDEQRMQAMAMEQRRADEMRQMEDQRRIAMEDQRRMEEQRRFEMDRQRCLEQQHRAEEERRMAALEEQRRMDMERMQALEHRRRVEEERRTYENRRLAQMDDQRRMQEEHFRACEAYGREVAEYEGGYRPLDRQTAMEEQRRAQELQEIYNEQRRRDGEKQPYSYDDDRQRCRDSQMSSEHERALQEQCRLKMLHRPTYNCQATDRQSMEEMRRHEMRAQQNLSNWNNREDDFQNQKYQFENMPSRNKVGYGPSQPRQGAMQYSDPLPPLSGRNLPRIMPPVYRPDSATKPLAPHASMMNSNDDMSPPDMHKSNGFATSTAWSADMQRSSGFGSSNAWSSDMQRSSGFAISDPWAPQKPIVKDPRAVAATKIQSLFRGFSARRRVEEKRYSKDDDSVMLTRGLARQFVEELEGAHAHTQAIAFKKWGFGRVPEAWTKADRALRLHFAYDSDLRKRWRNIRAVGTK